MRRRAKRHMLWHWLWINAVFALAFVLLPYPTAVAFAYTAVMFGITWWLIGERK